LCILNIHLICGLFGNNDGIPLMMVPCNPARLMIVVPLAYYFVVNENIYPSSDIYSIVASRMVYHRGLLITALGIPFSSVGVGGGTDVTSTAKGEPYEAGTDSGDSRS
jgi:MED6 mediator sub complex component